MLPPKNVLKWICVEIQSGVFLDTTLTCFIHSSILYCLSISHGQVLTMLLTTGTLPLFNLLFPSINIQILLICPKAFLTVLVGRNCFKTGLSSPFVIIFFILITSILG